MNTYREVEMPTTEEYADLYTFILLQPDYGVCHVIEVRQTGHTEHDAKMEAANTFSSKQVDGGFSLSEKDEWNRFMDESKLVEYINGEYFEKYRRANLPTIPKDNER